MGTKFSMELSWSINQDLSCIQSNSSARWHILYLYICHACSFSVIWIHRCFLVLQRLRNERRERRTAELIQQDKEIENQIQDAALERAKKLDTTRMGKKNIWRKEYENPNSDSALKLMRDQIIMARAYATIAKAKNEDSLYDSLINHSRENQLAIGEATSDAELQPRLVLLSFRY